MRIWMHLDMLWCHLSRKQWLLLGYPYLHGRPWIFIPISTGNNRPPHSLCKNSNSMEPTNHLVCGGMGNAFFREGNKEVHRRQTHYAFMDYVEIEKRNGIPWQGLTDTMWEGIVVEQSLILSDEWWGWLSALLHKLLRWLVPH